MTSFRAAVLYPDGHHEMVDVDRDTELKTLQDIIGGYIEATFSADMSVAFFIHEEGKFVGLPVNKRGTALWWQLRPAMRNQDVLVGNVVITGGPDRAGETTSIPPHMRALLDQTV